MAPPKKRDWRSAVDPKSGKTYYYDTHTRETQWRKPVELASNEERQDIKLKDQKQRDFFKIMEANMLKCMQTGHLPGGIGESDSSDVDSAEKEDVVVESLPLNAKRKPLLLSRNKKPKPASVRTISSMDSELLKELIQDQQQPISPSSSVPFPFPALAPAATKNGKPFATNFASPDSIVSDFMNLLPQPIQRHSPPGDGQHLHYVSSSDSDDTVPIIDPSTLKETNAYTHTHTHTLPSRSPPSYSNVSSKRECKKDIPKPNLNKRNTCGTMYVASTMADPDKDAAMKCVCGVYRTHILQSMNEPSMQTKFDEYEIFNDDVDETRKENCGYDSPRRHQNSARILESEAAIEMMVIDDDDEDGIPSLDEITYFFRFIFKKAQLETDVIIMSLIYVERLLKVTNGGVRPNVRNWKSVLFSCMIMASKVWDDLSMWNADFSQACPAGVTFPVKRINDLELAVLSCLKYEVKVYASEYAKYYFLMRSMIIRSGLAGEEFVANSPLDMEGAKKLEVLTSAVKPQFGRLRRAKSLGEIEDEKASDGLPHPISASSHLTLEQVVTM